LCTVSASVNKSHSSRATSAPATMALFLPVQPGSGGLAFTTRTEGNDCAISRVWSVEASSTTIISKGTPDCAASDSRQAPRHASSLRAGTITDTVGPPDTISSATISRISYYNFVRLASVSPGILALLLALTLTLAGCYGGSRPPHVGTSAPDFTVQDGDRKVSLDEFRGKILVLNFWATWCPPCVDEMPSLAQMQQKMKGKGVEVLAISVDVDQSAYQTFLRSYKVDLLTVRDPARKSNNLYGTFKFPETYIIDRQGVLRRKFVGPIDWGQPEIVEYLARL
jgi:cytochrome c biogenesis protein CcmG, thiol:disulfide interchange protein DsbE